MRTLKNHMRQSEGLCGLWILVLAFFASSAFTTISQIDITTKAEQGEWDADLTAVRGCSIFPTAYYAARGEVKVTKVRGRSNIKPGDSQEIKVGAFRLDQFSTKEKAFGCDMILTFVANQLKGKVAGDTAELREMVQGRLTEATLTRGERGLKARIVGTTQENAEITREGTLQPIPLGFANEKEFNEFASILSNYLSKVLAKGRLEGHIFIWHYFHRIRDQAIFIGY